MIAPFLLPDWPADTKWLSEEERALAVHRMEHDVAGARDTSEEKWYSGIGTAMRDPFVWLLVLLQHALLVTMSFTYCESKPGPGGGSSYGRLTLSSQSFQASSRHSATVAQRHCSSRPHRTFLHSSSVWSMPGTLGVQTSASGTLPFPSASLSWATSSSRFSREQLADTSQCSFRHSAHTLRSVWS